MNNVFLMTEYNFLEKHYKIGGRRKSMNKRLLLLSTLSFLAFLIVWVAVDSGLTVSVDNAMLKLFCTWTWLDKFTVLGFNLTIGICSIALVLFLWFRKRDYYGMLLVLVAVGGGYGLNTLIKNVVGRERPPFAHEDGFSFPSGHAMVGSIYLLLFAYFLSKEVKKTSYRWVVYLTFGLLALLTGLSRLSLQVHYPSDVLAGFLFACAYLSLCVAIYQHLKRNFPRV
jgi:undecaprenyl-diphosphatase